MSALDRVKDLMDRREPPETLAAFRIVIAIVTLARIARSLHTGMYTWAWVSAEWGGLRYTENPIFGGVLDASPSVVRALMIAVAVSLFLLLAGVWSRASAVCSLVLFKTLIATNRLASGGFDSLLIQALILLSVSNAGTALSVDAWRRRRAEALRTDEVPAWPRLVLLGQLGLMYLTTSFYKLLGGRWAPWTSMDAIWTVIHDPTWARFPSWVPGWLLFPSKVLTLGVLGFECVAPLVIAATVWCQWRRPATPLPRWSARAVTVFFAVGAMMHLGIAAVMEVGAFTPVTLAYYLCLIPPNMMWAWVARRPWRRTIRRPSGSAEPFRCTRDGPYANRSA
jgi:hypothetical protein